MSAFSEFGLVLTEHHPDATGYYTLHREGLVGASVRAAVAKARSSMNACGVEGERATVRRSASQAARRGACRDANSASTNGAGPAAEAGSLDRPSPLPSVTEPTLARL